MLQSLLADRMRRENLSARDAARQIGVSHTTVNRMLKGEIPNIDNLTLVAKWLGVSVAHALGVTSGTGDFATRIATIIEAEPRIKDLFSSIADDFTQGKLNSEDIEDILAYAAYRLGRRGGNDQSAGPLPPRDRGGT